MAVAIVKDLADNGQLDGLDRHKAGVLRLEQELIATGKFAASELGKLQLGQIILAAYAAS